MRDIEPFRLMEVPERARQLKQAGRHIPVCTTAFPGIRDTVVTTRCALPLRGLRQIFRQQQSPCAGYAGTSRRGGCHGKDFGEFRAAQTAGAGALASGRLTRIAWRMRSCSAITFRAY